jgi:hypothetical protein
MPSVVKRALSFALGLLLGQEPASAKLIRDVPLRESMLVLACFSICIFLSVWADFVELVTNVFWRLTIITVAVSFLFGLFLLLAAIEAGLTFWCIRRVGKIAHFKGLLCIIIFLEATFSLPSILTGMVGEKSWEGW